jgi:maleylacetate reductase
VKFAYVGLPARVVFGAGTIEQLGAEVERLGAKCVLLICTPGRAKMVRSVSKTLSVAGVFDQAVMHTRVEITERAVAA